MIHADETINSKVIFKFVIRQFLNSYNRQKKKIEDTNKIKYNNMMGAS